MIEGRDGLHRNSGLLPDGISPFLRLMVWSWVAACLVLAGPQEPKPEDAGAPPAKLAVSVDLVRLNASVRSVVSGSATDLRAEDFEILEDGQVQRIQQFEPTSVPFSLLLVLDVSSSTESYLGLMKEATAEFIRRTREGDSLAVLTFNEETNLVHPFSTDRESLIRSVQHIQSGGWTALYDALHDSLAVYLGGVKGRKAVVLFSDGLDSSETAFALKGSKYSQESVTRALEQSDAILYTIFLDSESPSMADPFSQKTARPSPQASNLQETLDLLRRHQPPPPTPAATPRPDSPVEWLRRVSNQSGGRLLLARRITDLAGLYHSVATELGTQYTLGYYSTNVEKPRGWRSIQVFVRRQPQLEVRTRKGYFYTGGPP